jgi:phage terminase large subunit GpA-like protein
MNEEKFTEPDIPTEQIKIVTAGVDIGERFANYELVGWGPGRESWGLEYGFLDSDPRGIDLWKMLDAVVYNRVLTTGDQKEMRCAKIAIDAGYASDYVYQYTKRREPRAIACKGEGGLHKPLLKSSSVTKTNRARLIILGVDSGKEEVTARLRVTKPGPGFCHFPRGTDGESIRGYDQEFFKGLTCERRIIKHKLGFRTFEWQKPASQRNEPFDVRILATAALQMLIVSGRKLDEMERDIWSESAGIKTEYFGARTMGLPDGIIYGAGAIQPMAKISRVDGKLKGFGAVPGSGLKF